MNDLILAILHLSLPAAFGYGLARVLIKTGWAIYHKGRRDALNECEMHLLRKELGEKE
jgi:hypothetical protein